MKYEVIKPFKIGEAEFYIGDTIEQGDLEPFFSNVLISGSLRAKSEKRIRAEAEAEA